MSVRPYVIVGGFMSVDGKIAPTNRKGKLLAPLMGETLLKRLHQLRAEVDAVLVGAKTVIEDNPRLTVRAIQGRNPVRVVLDSSISAPLDSEIFDINDAPTVIAVCENAPKDRKDMLARKGVEIISFRGKEQIPIGELLNKLHRKGIRKILVEGGSEVRWSFIRDRLVDELFVWITPLILGGRAAPTLVGGEGYSRIESALRLRLKSHEVIDGTVILEYYAS
jgi:2,5-diamino-6-hydroxy-4-(5-phosphoribosylamino)pyrimidine 1'-reductase